MNAESTTRRHDGRAHAVAAEAAATAAPVERRAPTFDNVLERWRHGCARAGLGGELGASSALLQAMAALQHLQFDALEHARAALAEAQSGLAAARSPADVAGVGLRLAQSHAASLLNWWSRSAEIALGAGADGWTEAIALATRAQGLGDEIGRHWLDAAAHERPAEALEVQLKQLATPAAALPLWWPAQESLREAATLGTRALGGWFAALPVPASRYASRAPTGH